MCSVITDGTHQTPHYISKGIPFISTANLKPFSSGFDFSEYKRFISASEHVALTKRCAPEKGDVLISKCGTIGRVKEIDVDFPFSIFVGLALLKLQRGVFSHKFVEFWLNSPSITAQFEELAPGSTRRTLTLKGIKSVEIPIPPFEEQRRIVTKMEALLDEVKAGQERLNRTRAMLKRFRQAVLDAACSGRLTKGWRGAPQFGEEDLPATWRHTTVGELVKVATGATPLRRNSAYYDEGTIPWVTSGAVNQGIVTRADEYVTDLAIRETNAKVFPPGTLLLAMYGEGATRGKVAELGISAATNQALAAILFDEISAPLRPFLKIALQSQYAQHREAAAGGVQPNLSLGAVRAIPVKIPPSSEQQEIVRRVDALFGLAKAVEKQLAVATARANMLTQSILGKALCGELVPTEAELARQEGRDYEPASVLLARMRRESVGEGEPEPLPKGAGGSVKPRKSSRGRRLAPR